MPELHDDIQASTSVDEHAEQAPEATQPGGDEPVEPPLLTVEAIVAAFEEKFITAEQLQTFSESMGETLNKRFEAIENSIAIIDAKASEPREGGGGGMLDSIVAKIPADAWINILDRVIGSGEEPEPSAEQSEYVQKAIEAYEKQRGLADRLIEAQITKLDTENAFAQKRMNLFEKAINAALERGDEVTGLFT